MKYLSILLVLFVSFISCNEEQKKDIAALENTKLSGPVFGTSFNVVYDSEVNYIQQIDSLFAVVNQSMSTYIPDSDISKLNRNEAVVVDSHFKTVLDKSFEVYNNTNGVFDPTIGAVVNAWDFGPEGKIVGLDSIKINQLMKFVGLNNVFPVNDGEGLKVTKSDSTFLDFNAIAKGYGVDVIGEYLESKGVENYLVEIGGEIRCKGKNIERNNSWNVGLDRPRFDGIQDQNPLRAIRLENESMATSGTYRKFKIDDNGNRYTHIINTKTGYPSKTNILSISVITEDCMTADAYATAFQAMGIEKVTEFLKSHPELKVFLVFENDTNEFETLNLNNFPE